MNEMPSFTAAVGWGYVCEIIIDELAASAEKFKRETIRRMSLFLGFFGGFLNASGYECRTVIT